MRQYICFLLTVVTLGMGIVRAEDNSLNGPWKMTVRQPADNWTQTDFQDAGWTEAMGGFGSPGTPAARISTEWRTRNIWLRRTVNVDAVPATPALYLHHDEDAEVFLNGKKIATFSGYTSDYFVHKLDSDAAKEIKQGDNLLAVHCKQTTGGQFIDVHLIDANQVPELPAPITPTDPFKSELITQWGAEVSADNAWPEYPRPQMVRSAWTNLNGNWNYAITKQS
ncbi:MAG: hypothetical protein KDA87_27230, partial [Planctomycetales bacterium]|nr:hypothetical protein [Planctomycetales bacterium]